MVNIFQKVAVAGAAIALGSLGTLPAKATTLGYDGLYVFGDSLSDTGNVFSATQGQYPAQPYDRGRFSNGPNWVDDLGQDLGLTPTPVAQIQLNNAPAPQGINFAFGGATTGTANTLNTSFNLPEDGTGLPGLVQEIGSFAQTSPVADPQALYILWAGANDYLPTNSKSFTPFQTPTNTVTNLSQSVQLLASLGARNILIADLPDLGQTPLVNKSSSASTALNNLTSAHNQLLSKTESDLSQSLPGVNLIPLDLNQRFKDITADPSKFGFTNVSDSCFVNPSANSPGSVCSNPDQYLFWDSSHPTTAVHKLIAEEALNTIESKSVPEPTADNALWLLSFGFIVKKILSSKRSGRQSL
jgi:phospholipase/lecithinase/hemolysin